MGIISKAYSKITNIIKNNKSQPENKYSLIPKLDVSDDISTEKSGPGTPEKYSKQISRSTDRKISKKVLDFSSIPTTTVDTKNHREKFSFSSTNKNSDWKDWINAVKDKTERAVRKELVLYVKKLDSCVKEIDLSNRNISSLPEGFFSRFDQLENLNLSHNRFKNFDTNCIYNSDYLTSYTFNSRLTTLNLSNNLIESFKTHNTESSSIKKLYLSHNNLSIIDKSFSNLTNLIEGDFSNNEISKIDKNVFKENNNLKSINLSHNYLIKEINYDPICNLLGINNDNDKNKSNARVRSSMIWKNSPQKNRELLRDNVHKNWDYLSLTDLELCNNKFTEKDIFEYGQLIKDTNINISFYKK